MDKGVVALDELIESYEGSLRNVRQLKKQELKDEDKTHLNSMESDLVYSLEWLKTGRRPGNRRGIENKAAYQREVIWSTLTYNTIRKLELRESRKQMLLEQENYLLDGLLSQLSKSEREAYVAIRGQGLSYSQVARMMCVSRSTVQSYVERADRKMKEIVKEKKIQLGFL